VARDALCRGRRVVILLLLQRVLQQTTGLADRIGIGISSYFVPTDDFVKRSERLVAKKKRG
jgi:hypothetical protein